MRRLTRDGTAKPFSRDQTLRRERGQGKIHFPCSADHEQDWQPYPVVPYSAMCDDHAHIHTTSILLNTDRGVSTGVTRATNINKWTPPRKSGGIPQVSTRFSLSMEMRRLARDGAAELVSRDQIFRREQGQGSIHFFLFSSSRAGLATLPG